MSQEQTTTLLPSESVPTFITKTFDHYFGNYNYIKDQFLQEQAKAGQEGWIDLSIFEKFKKVSEYIKSEELKPFVTEGLKKGKYFIFDEEKKAVKRNPDIPVPESSISYWQGCKDRTVYMKGFPKDANLDDIIAFCEKYGVVENVSKCNNKQTKEFKGSVFTIYETIEEMQKAIEGTEKFGEDEISRISREEHFRIHAEENKKKKEEAKNMKENKNKDAENLVAAPVFKSGNVLELSGLPENAKVEEIKLYFKLFGDCAFVLLEDGGKGKVRFAGDEENIGKQALEKALETGEGKLKLYVEEGTVEARVLNEEEEKEYWKQYLLSRNQKNGKGNFRNKGGYNRGRGNNFKNNKRKNETNGDVNEKKSKNVEN
uniref:Lupus La protein n=1 Tax=Parastrongyloides trichosuri TaxID=131310 RepID=A0A0N5A2M5_PARTI